ncbi:GNAT family N-acetyltransferase [uncultured Shewanella sp.]|uniref:GNAT family N-acetyltransferase n=1 Tax=uncultured Shewanella sp. TaxID=173975 RepID=UPI0026186824|nr:GNAT family N-acetyltransferase [uncultured Shewanella sp.]
MKHLITPFIRDIAGLGTVEIKPIDLSKDISFIHQWVSQDYAHFWGMQNQSLEQVSEAYRSIEAGNDARTFIGWIKGKPQFLIEVYEPSRDRVGEHYPVEKEDKGMHILIAPCEVRIPQFTFNIFRNVMAFLFTDPNTHRIVVEPDHQNTHIHTLNKRAGFIHERLIKLGEKTAYLGFCTREQFNQAMYKETLTMSQPSNTANLQSHPEMAVSAIQPDVWALVNRLHVKKCIAELAHEKVITPVLLSNESNKTDAWKHYELQADQAGVSYFFKAQKLALSHWLIDENSIEKRINDEVSDLDSLLFIIEFCQSLNIDPDKLPTYMEEISSTLCGSAYKYTKNGLTSQELTQADFQQVETAMNEGHPSFIANNGRIGFDAIDYRAYAPEAASSVKLIYLAAHKRRAHFSSAHDLNYETLLAEEMDKATLDSFNQIIADKGYNPNDYLLIPVHPWQWYNKLATVFSPDIACGDLICLGYGDDAYLAQQSIRTFFNISHSNKHYVKTALSVLNMGFMRGLSAYYMRTTPAINDWVNNLVNEDDYLQLKGFSILREVAAVGYRNPYYENEVIKDSPYKKMLAALWRESPTARLKENQRLMTMASLLHIDPNGDALLPALIASSGMSIDEWLTRYFDVYLTPLLHCYYQHSLVFMPHGENLILQFENNVPHKAIMKDIGEEICLLNTDIELDDQVKRISIKMPEELEVLSIFTDVFDCFFRYMSAILVEQSNYSEQAFWRLVAECIQGYQAEHPELAAKFEQHDLFAPEFTLSCLNRLQLGNNQQMINLSDPSENLKFAGNLINPIAQFKR